MNSDLLPYIGLCFGIVLVLGYLVLLVDNRLNGFVRKTVAAVYRVAIRAAVELEDEGLSWLRSEEGIAFRRGLVGSAW